MPCRQAIGLQPSGRCARPLQFAQLPAIVATYAGRRTGPAGRGAASSYCWLNPMGTRRTLVVIEPGRAGDVAVSEARAHAGLLESHLTLVGVAPQAAGPRCGTSILEYNAAIIDAVTHELARARDRLVSDGICVACRLLIEGRDPSLEEFAAGGEFDLILLPSRRPRLGRARHPAAERLTTGTPAEVRLVAARPGRREPTRRSD